MPSDALKGLQSKNFTTQIQSSCGTIPTEDIKRYYDIAIAMDWGEQTYIPLGGSDTQKFVYKIEQPWVQEIWDKVNPGCVLLKHYLKRQGKNQSESIDAGVKEGEYSIIVYLKPDMKPEDGGTLEFWTPNLTDEMRAAAWGTPWGLDGEAGKDILRSYSPEAGRVVVFDSRIPHVQRSVEADKSSISLVFKGSIGEPKGLGAKPIIM